MIEINLLPNESRRGQEIAFNLPHDFLKKLVTIGICAVILPSMLIPALTFTKSLLLRRVNKALDSIAPQRKQIDQIREERLKHTALEKLFSSLFQSRLSVAPRLNAVSNGLPQGLWLDEFLFSGSVWEIKGKCFSASSSEMAQIGQFLNILKSDKDSARAFGGLELGLVQRKKIGPTEIAEWTINSKKPKVDSPVKKKPAEKIKKSK